MTTIYRIFFLNKSNSWWSCF